MSGGLSDHELAAIEGLYAGDLEPLGALLNEMLGSGTHTMHPSLLFQLRLMISGKANECDWRLDAKRHPELGKGQSGSEQDSQVRKELGTALAMARNGALLKGGYEAAIAETMAQTGLGRATVAAHWSRRKAHIEGEIRWGIIRQDDLPQAPAESDERLPD